MSITCWCGGCTRPTVFERLEGDHPDGCVELFCVECGGGAELGPVQGAGAAA